MTRRPIERRFESRSQKQFRGRFQGGATGPAPRGRDGFAGRARVFACGLPLLFVLASNAGCTLGYYDLDQRLAGAKTDGATRCPASFSLTFEGFEYTNTFGARDMTSDAARHRQRAFVAATRDVLAAQGCPKVARVDAPAEADLRIAIVSRQNNSALPQEWLTGLSFGLIPSWGTRPDQYVYTFETRRPARSHRYTVDEKSVSQLLLVPIAWITLFAMQETRPYKTALVNYLSHTADVSTGAAA